MCVCVCVCVCVCYIYLCVVMKGSIYCSCCRVFFLLLLLLLLPFVSGLVTMSGGERAAVPMQHHSSHMSNSSTSCWGQAAEISISSLPLSLSPSAFISLYVSVIASAFDEWLWRTHNFPAVWMRTWRYWPTLCIMWSSVSQDRHVGGSSFIRLPSLCSLITGQRWEHCVCQDKVDDRCLILTFTVGQWTDQSFGLFSVRSGVLKQRQQVNHHNEEASTC